MTKISGHQPIGSFTFDVEAGELRDRSGALIPLRPQTAAVLAYLVSRRGRVVPKSDLLDTVWKDTHVTDDSVVQCISEIRKALGRRDGSLLKTVPKHGYRLLSQRASADEIEPVPRGRPAGGWRSPLARRSAVLVALFAALTMAGIYAVSVPREPGPDAAVTIEETGPTIAVLPFEGIGIPVEHAHLPDGLTDDLTTALARHRGVTVISRESTFLYRGDDVPTGEIYRRLNVSHLLRGSLRSEGDRLRVNLQLSEVGRGGIIWADTFAGSVQEVFALEARIVTALGRELTGGAAQTESTDDLIVRTSSQQAYRAFELGRQLFFTFQNSASNLRARALFEEALTHDPDFAIAHAMLAVTYSFAAQNAWAPDRDDALERAELAARAAISRDPRIPLSYFVIGLVFRERGDYDSALVEARKAIKLDPNYANAHVLLATILYYTGRAAESVDVLKQAMRLNPHHPFQYNFHLGQALFTLGRYESAIEALLEGVASNPSSERLHVWLAASYARAGLLDDATWEAEQVLIINPTFSVVAASAAYPFQNPLDRQSFLDGLRMAGLS